MISHLPRGIPGVPTSMHDHRQAADPAVRRAGSQGTESEVSLHHPLIDALADALLAVPWDREALQRGFREVLGGYDPLAAGLAARLWTDARPDRGEAVRLLVEDVELRRLLQGPVVARRRAWHFPEEDPAPLRFEGLPELPDVAALARWLGWSVPVLLGHADLRHDHRRRAEYRDYVYRWHGARLIEAPKDRLAGGQRRILRELLVHVPLHDAAHGFVRGRSPRTHARLHVGCAVVVRVDLERFFASITAPRVRGMFRALGYPRRVASLLAGLTTSWPPPDVVPGGSPWSAPHLPQGAPTSPALANIVSHGLDRRLQGLARHHGAAYSRYADDLTFSGRALPSSLVPTIEQIAVSEGFRVRRCKTRRMGEGAAQRVTGLIVNRHVAVSRRERDHLRALLHLALTRGPASVRVEGVDDVRSWLRGRIAWVAHARPAHAERMLEVFHQIAWTA
ncbi:MAG: RNA-directed DNA polymerase [Myxococcales bacterium]|nr:RNA-directed DNA polymerase [Myxococcales bacterium]